MLKRAYTLLHAMARNMRVSEEIEAERIATCRDCNNLRVDHKGFEFCGICGCSISKPKWRIRNLTAHVENLPRWGCKHPQRRQGKGWRR